MVLSYHFQPFFPVPIFFDNVQFFRIFVRAIFFFVLFFSYFFLSFFCSIVFVVIYVCLFLLSANIIVYFSVTVFAANKHSHRFGRCAPGSMRMLTCVKVFYSSVLRIFPLYSFGVMPSCFLKISQKYR